MQGKVIGWFVVFIPSDAGDLDELKYEKPSDEPCYLGEANSLRG
jgi:hypothetical protein